MTLLTVDVSRYAKIVSTPVSLNTPNAATGEPGTENCCSGINCCLLQHVLTPPRLEQLSSVVALITLMVSIIPKDESNKSRVKIVRFS